MAGRVTKFMRTLKALVIGMGILIVAGTAVIAVMIARRGADGAAGDNTASGGASTTPAKIALPAGARVIETALDGDRIALRIVLTGGGERVMIIDARTGRRIGAVDLMPGPRDGGGATTDR